MFSPSTSVSPANLYSTKFSIITITGGRYNRPFSDRRAEWTQFGLHYEKSFIPIQNYRKNYCFPNTVIQISIGLMAAKISRKSCWILSVLNSIIKPISDLKKIVNYVSSLGFPTKFLNSFLISPKHLAPSKRIQIGFDLSQFNPLRVSAIYFLQNNDSTLQP
jgi:hypothetical protein